MSKTEAHASDVAIARLLLGKGSEEDAAHVAGCDRCRLALGEARFVLIGSVDGRGRANLYYSSTTVAADAGPVQILADSIVLDDAPGPERIFAVFSDRRLQDREVEAVLEELGAGGAEAVRRT